MTTYYRDQSASDIAYAAYDTAPADDYGTVGVPCTWCGKPLTDADTQCLNPHHLCKACALRDIDEVANVQPTPGLLALQESICRVVSIAAPS